MRHARAARTSPARCSEPPTRRASRPGRAAPACCSPRASRSSRARRRPAGALARDRAGGARRGDRGAHGPCPERGERGDQAADARRGPRRARRARARPRVLCGDLNTPRREAPDGTVWSFARDGRGRLRAERAGAWDAAELGVVPGLRDLGFADAFRARERLRVARAELDVAADRRPRRRLAARPRLLLGRARARRVRLPPRLARGRAQRPLGARGGSRSPPRRGYALPMSYAIATLRRRPARRAAERHGVLRPGRAPSCAAASPPRGSAAWRRRASCTRQHVPQMAGAEEVLAALDGDGRTAYSALVLNPKGLERAAGGRRATRCIVAYR